MILIVSDTAGAKSAINDCLVILFFYGLSQTATCYTRQVNGVKLADILFLLLCVCLSVCVSVRTQPVFNSAVQAVG